MSDVPYGLVGALEEAVARRIARWLEWRSGATMFCKRDGIDTPVSLHPSASSSGWGEAGMAAAAKMIREGQWKEEPDGGF